MAMTELVLTFRNLGLRLLSSNNITGRITPTESTIVLKPLLVHILLTFIGFDIITFTYFMF